MKIVFNLFFLSLILLFGLTLSGCENKKNIVRLNRNKSKSFSSIYRIKNIPLTSLSTDWAINLNTNHFSEKLSMLCEYSYNKNQFRIIDLSTDEIKSIIKFPKGTNKIGSISFSDTSSFAFLTDTTFYVYRNNNFQEIEYKTFNDGYIPLNYINIIYKPKENKLISGVLTYSKRKKQELDYSSFFLNIYDLNTMKSKLIPFSYPKQFHGNKLGIPMVYLSEWNNDLIVSFELDDNIYKINLKTNKVDTILCKSSISNIKYALFPKQGNKQSKIDAIQKNSLNVGGYGMAFFNKELNKIYRIYRPGLPIKDQNGNYFNSTDIGTHIIELDVSTNKIKEIQLANGQYYVPTFWSYNRYNNSIIYPKLDEHVKKKNICFYNIHCISIFNQ